MNKFEQWYERCRLGWMQPSKRDWQMANAEATYTLGAMIAECTKALVGAIEDLQLEVRKMRGDIAELADKPTRVTIRQERM
jgi:hypothetical protein